MDKVEGWNKWSVYVVRKIEEHDKAIAELQKENATLKAEIKALQVKSGFWGIIGGALTVFGSSWLKK